MAASAPNFSPSLTLAGMDYIAPSAACIKPTLINGAAAAGGGGGGVAGGRKGGASAASLPAVTPGGSGSGSGHADVVKITLQDCLACSGCVTTAETVLVNAQSRSEIITTLLGTSPASRPAGATSNATCRQASSRARLVSISPQSCASLAAYVRLSMDETYALISGFLHTVLTPAGLQAQAAAAPESTLQRSAEDSGKRSAPGDEEASTPTSGPASHVSSSVTSPPIYVIDLEWAEQLSAALTAQEYTRRRDEAPETLPMIVSACPGWVCYCEKQGSVLLPHLCPVMSAQGIAGSYAKRTVAPDLYHISIQPCFDRKLEAARDSMASTSSPAVSEEAAAAPVFYTDCVLSTAELLEWMKEVDPRLPWRAPLSNRAAAAGPATSSVEQLSAHLAENEEEKAQQDGGPASVVSAAARAAARLAGSGRYHQCVIADRLRRQLDASATAAAGDGARLDASMEVHYEIKRNHNHQLATCAALPGEVFCVGYGFQQIQNVVRGLKKKMPAMRGYTFVELMACPDGCLNGGGQVRPAQQPHSEVLDAVITAYVQHLHADRPVERQKDEDVAEKATQRRRMELAPEAVIDVEDAVKRRPFVDATIAAVAPSLGDGLWRCAFRDREKEFAEMLNAGNIHSLKW
ncbi:putative Hydrogenase [Leptomonas pyrrhocoris]|uniref:Putative Hydrogenase n=1 Tax=Leptomonas pyrrhocoris TaxID=157538 RepID=A0A0N0DVS3_LEPPY|nr:putative Hydrogenase [Leptomonas pyrrhocoris]KPA80772.1 putative Hydrogenase [Leptomonas pyrrhocoris]|eukprot:XP_015659211.1 putative Hydrogenase [Leptomonas pyrrhocoris]